MANGLEKAVEQAVTKPALNRDLNKKVREYFDLVERQKELSAQVDSAKKYLMGFDGITTDKWKIYVQATPTERMAGKQAIFDAFGEDEVRNLGLVKKGESKSLKIEETENGNNS